MKLGSVSHGIARLSAAGLVIVGRTLVKLSDATVDVGLWLIRQAEKLRGEVA